MQATISLASSAVSTVCAMIASAPISRVRAISWYLLRGRTHHRRQAGSFCKPEHTAYGLEVDARMLHVEGHVVATGGLDDVADAGCQEFADEMADFDVARRE